MCRERSDQEVIKPYTPPDLGEYNFARKQGWFSVAYSNNNKTRYVYVSEARYGIVWQNSFFFVILHALFFYALWMVFEHGLYSAWIYSYCAGYLSGVGVTAGAHRLWSHKTYKAKLPMRMLLSVLFTMAGQNDIYTWARDHRLHHKFTETDADPHNSRRGAFFAHVGWLLTKKHPDVLIKGRTIDHHDLLEDSVVYYNKKFYVLWYLLFRVYLPSMIPAWFFGEELRYCLVGCLAQYIAGLHTTWFVNSAAHMFGDRPYNAKIQPRENFFVSLMTFNEGFHNYHHTFPFDYKISEFGLTWYNPGKLFIDTMYWLGQATDLKEASKSLVSKTKKTKTGGKYDSEFYLHDHPYHEPHNYSEGG